MIGDRMASAGAWRFRALLGMTKRVIFAVDGVRVRLRGGAERKGTGAEVRIPRGRGGSLRGWEVEPRGTATGWVLLFHGIGDRLEYWREAQEYLAGHGVGSLIFSYSGYSGSTGKTTPGNLEEDGRAAYLWLG